MKRYDLELTATGPVMEERKEGAFVPFTEVAGLKAQIQQLLEQRSREGLDVSNAILDGIVPDQHPMRSRLELLANHHKREIELAVQLSDATRQCGLMADSLRYQREFVTTNVWDDEERNLLLEHIDAALAGTLPDPTVTVTETIRTAPERIWLQVGDQEHYHSEPFPSNTSEVTWCRDSVTGCEVPYVRADLVGKVPTPVVPEGWQLVPVEVTLPMQHAYFGVIDKNMQRVETDCRFGRYDSAKEAYLAMLAAAPKPEPTEQHPDDAAVDRFVVAMKAKLAAAREKGRGGWDDPNACSVEYLADLLVNHVAKGNAETFEDVANFAMMLHQRGADPAILASAATLTTCATCSGHGMIGGVTGQTPESMDFWETGCPDCDGRGKVKVNTRTITPAQEDELVTVLQSIVGGFSDDPAHDAAALLKRITGEVPWTGDSFQLPPSQGGDKPESAT